MLKKVMALFLSLVLLSALVAGCGSKKEPATTGTNQQTGSNGTQSAGNAKLSDLIDTVDDSSDLPTWTGKVLKLRNWYGHGTGNYEKLASSKDVFNPEIKRVFGIEWDVENSFDNSGTDLQTKISMLAATKDWPEVGQSVIDEATINNGVLYDLTDLIPKYMPHYYALLKQYFPRSLKAGYNGTGKLYGINYIDNDVPTMQRLYPDLDMSKYQYVNAPTEWSWPMWVRDDILKKVYPNAKTQDEIEALYVKNGNFTKDDIYDIPLKSRQDVIDFFYNIKKVIDQNKIKEGGRPVSATWATYGYDNWPTLEFLTANMRGLHTSNWYYFNNYNMKTQHIELGFTSSWFKEDLYTMNKMVRDGVASEESLIDTNDIFMNKLNNGEYAISYGWLVPEEAKLKAANKPYRYRKVYMDIPADNSTYITFSSEADMTRAGISIFKDKVKEEDVPQILQYLDFLYSETGKKLMVWGPRSAGMFKEENGVRKYTDKDLEACMVYNTENNADQTYNLASSIMTNGRWFPIAYPQIEAGIRCGGLQNPKYAAYDLTNSPREATSANKFFTSALISPIKYSKLPVLKSPIVLNFVELPDVKKFWDVRGTGWEPQLTKVMAAKSDAEFETSFNNMVKYATDNGLNEKTCADIEKLIQDKYPDDWAAYVAGY